MRWWWRGGGHVVQVSTWLRGVSRRPPRVLTAQALGTEMVYVKRGNRLDTVICGVKDCFDTEAEAGYTVDPRNGTKISMCFER